MDTQQGRPEEQLRRRELEVSELRRNLLQLRTKFFQLERAFEINLQVQSQREVEFNRIKQENQELQKFKEETLRARTDLSSKLTNATIERDHWKNAYLQQKEFLKKNEIERNNAVGLVKRECEDILKMTREAAEKQFQDLIELYNGAREEVTRLEKQVGIYQSSRHEHENRTFELANLLETLKRFDLDVGPVCQLVAEALENLTDRGNLFEENMKNLRHLAWTTENKKVEPELVLLRKQNSVLKEVVKNLKRKAQQQLRNEISEREHEHRNSSVPQEAEINSKNFEKDLPNESKYAENNVTGPEKLADTLSQENHDNHETKEHEEQTDRAPNRVTAARANENRKNEFDIESKLIDRCGKVLCVETHSNGVSYEEYIFKLSIDREIKLKYPLLLNNNNEEAVKMEFVDNENEYERASLSAILIFFKNIYASVKVKQTGVPCGTQTMRIKNANSATQTTLTGIHSFSRLNAGVTMLNSEKRAIERSLYNLERTVRTLKFNALDQARTMVGKDSRFLGNDKLFDCIRLLSQ